MSCSRNNNANCNNTFDLSFNPAAVSTPRKARNVPNQYPTSQNESLNSSFCPATGYPSRTSQQRNISNQRLGSRNELFEAPFSPTLTSTPRRPRAMPIPSPSPYQTFPPPTSPQGPVRSLSMAPPSQPMIPSGANNASRMAYVPCSRPQGSTTSGLHTRHSLQSGVPSQWYQPSQPTFQTLPRSPPRPQSMPMQSQQQMLAPRRLKFEDSVNVYETPTLDASGQRKWNQMEDNLMRYEQMLREQQMQQLKDNPNTTILREKHNVEQREFDCVRKKNRLKMLYKLENNISGTVSDDEVFAGMFQDPTIYHPPDISQLQSQSAYPDSNRYESMNNLYNENPYPAMSEIGKSTEKSDKGPCGVCSADNANDNFTNDLAKIVMHMLKRRRLIKAAIEQSVKYSGDKLDCRGKKIQEKAAQQLENYLNKDVLMFYNNLMQYHKDSISSNSKKCPGKKNNAMRNKYFGDYRDDDDDLSENQIRYGKEVANTINALINEYATREASMNEEYVYVAESYNDNEMLAGYQEDIVKAMAHMSEGFMSLWNEFEEQQNNCCPLKNLNSPLTIIIGSTIQEILATQFRTNEELEKKVGEVGECVECNIGQQAEQLADTEELDKLHVQITNDVWDILETVAKQLECREGRPCTSADTSSRVFRAILAIYRKYNGQIKNLMNEHYESRRQHDSDSMDETFDEEWQSLREELSAELNDIASSLSYEANENMSCQEKRLKQIQEEQVSQLREKYEKLMELHPCNAQQYEYSLSTELADLDKEHMSQWEQLVASKLEYKTEKIEQMYPNESNRSCLQTCAKAAAEGRHRDKDCVCKKNSSSQKEEYGEMRSSFQGSSGGPRFSSSNALPDLNSIEVKEMEELQMSLRKWQTARRRLLESMNTSTN